MESLGMPHGVFEISLGARNHDEPRPWGIDDIEFLISANPGQPPMPFARIASGGELSRMSLAVQVIASDGSAIPTMVFDEVDSGVGGGVAEMVGLKLRDLGETRQVFCVTHLPQVAGLADHHFRISKFSDGKSTKTVITCLGDDERVEELARMLGGVEITARTREHAAEMLRSGSLCRADIQHEVVVDEFEIVRFRNIPLYALDFVIHEFNDFAGFYTDHVVMVLAIIHFEYRMPAFEIVPGHEARSFELRQYAIHRRQTDILARVEQLPVDVLCTQVARFAFFQYLQDLQPRQRDLEAGLS
jgi:hypothetical protein